MLNITGNSNLQITSLCYDSRKANPGSAFFALKGETADGHNFIAQALLAGATAIVCEHFDENSDAISNAIKNINHEYSIAVVKNSRQALAEASHEFFNHPADDLFVYGVTGTNGKTTTTFLLKEILEAAGMPTGIIGTTGIYYKDVKIEATHTTPESLELAETLFNMKKSGVEAVVMEVSSHALSQHRADGIRFLAAGFTNLTHEHLDYHKTMSDYAAAKRILFDGLDEKAVSVFIAGPYAELMSSRTKSKKYMISRNPDSIFRIKNEKLGLDSTSFNLILNKTLATMNERFLPPFDMEIKTPLVGRFNIENAALAAAMSVATGIEPETVRIALRSAVGAPGRMQRIRLKSDAVAIVDYAHSPDALEKALRACRELLYASRAYGNRLICVFGCGGDRDKTKRPEMGRIAVELADFVILTDDNPRTEDPKAIIDDIYAGVLEEDNHKIEIINSRSAAIEYAYTISGANDIILVAGKGHENYQIIGKEKIHFDDCEELAKFC